MGIEQQERGDQYDPAEIAIDEQQGPIDLAHEATIRARFWSNEPNLRNSCFPERRGRIRLPEPQYSGIAAAWRAEELEHEEVLPGMDIPKPFTPSESDHEL